MTRRFTILRRIGAGGQGTVYHARLEEGDGGAGRDVALKLLKEGQTDEGLDRCREEARILNLVRDRAVVWVEPPVRLGDRWAQVMELAEGVSAKWAVVRGGPLPPTVALEIVQEVARLLARIYETEGPDGRPLRLVHCDIKPGNLQITVDGGVKLLDFGVARVDVHHREQEIDTIGATPGFVAPERLRGIDTPACDVYSLGVTLRVLCTGEWPQQQPRPPEDHAGDVREAVAFAEEMFRPDPASRPTTAGVERRAGELRARLSGPSLRDWATARVPELVRPADDPLVGTVLVPEPPPPPVPEPPPGPRPPARIRAVVRWAALGAAALAVVALGAVGSVVVLVGLGLTGDPSARLVPGGGGGVEAQVAAADGAGGGEAADTGKNAPIRRASQPGSGSPAARPVAPESEPATASIAAAPAAPRASALPPAAPAPKVEARPDPPDAGPALVEVTVSAVRPSTVWIDDEQVGHTPLRLPVTPGRHALRLSDGEGTVEATVLVGGRRGATRFEWAGGPNIGVR